MRSRTLRPLYLAAVMLAGLLPAAAQVSYRDPAPFVPRYTLGFNYSTTRSNAPPEGRCECFSTNGIAVENATTIKYWLRAATELNYSRASSIGPLGQDLSLTTITAGPQVVLHGRRFDTFAQTIFGLAHGANSYFPKGASYSTSASSFAWKMGGGFDVNLNHALAVRAVEAQYLHTSFPNGVNDSQNHLTLSFGVVWKLKGRLWTPSY
jgi:hypothetical protein